MWRDLSMSRKLELLNTFLEAYGATKTRSQVDVFLRGLLRVDHEKAEYTLARTVEPELKSIAPD